MTKNGVAFLTLADKQYPQKLAFLYLQDIAEAFTDELRNKYGTQGVDYQSKIETIDNSYAFLKFGKFFSRLMLLENVINKKRKEYRDSNTNENIHKLNEELMDVSKIMNESLEMILNRDKNLSKMSQISSDIKEDAKKVNFVY